MAYKGRYRQGRYYPLSVLCRQGGVPTWPDDCPSAVFYGNAASGGASAGLTERFKLPVIEPARITGWFGMPYRLAQDFGTPGYYSVEYRFTIEGTAYTFLDYFQIVPGGTNNGNVIGLAYFPRPQGNYLVQDLDSGRLAQNLGPNV